MSEANPKGEYQDDTSNPSFSATTFYKLLISNIIIEYFNLRL